jgi:hypothetical protein
VWRPDDLLRSYLDAVADACARAAGPARAARAARGPRGAHGLAAEAWTPPCDGRPGRVLPPDRQGPGRGAHRLGRPAARGAGRGAARLCLRLELPTDTAGDEAIAAGASWPLDYLLQAADDPSLLVPAADVWAHAGGRLPLGDRALADAQESLVRGLAEAARLVPPLASSLDEAAPVGLTLDAHGAGAFLADAATLSAAGIGVLLPAELTAGGQRRLRARLRARATTAAPGNERAGGLAAEDLAAFAWEAAVGDEPIDPDEFARIVALKQPLVRWRGRWVRVDPDEAATLASLLGDEQDVDTVEVLAAALTGQREVPGWARSRSSRTGRSRTS